jgi:hypothetical protein
MEMCRKCWTLFSAENGIFTLTDVVVVPSLFLLTIAASASGGFTVGTSRSCYGEATAKVGTSIARQGPKGSAAEYSTRLFDETILAVTFTFRGTCQAASGFSFAGRREGLGFRRQLTKPLKRLNFLEGDRMRTKCKNVPFRYGSACGNAHA